MGDHDSGETRGEQPFQRYIATSTYRGGRANDVDAGVECWSQCWSQWWSHAGVNAEDNAGMW